VSKRWRYLLPLAWPLLAVNVAFALLYAAIWCRAHSWSFRNGVLTFIAGARKDGSSRLLFNPGAQGWSPIVGYANEWQRQRDDLRAHENCHVVQEIVWACVGLAVGAALLMLGHPTAGIVVAFCGGPMFAITYGVHFAIEFAPPFVREYRWHRAAGAAWKTSAKLAALEWRPAYERIIYERQAYARQRAYLAMTPERRAAAWT